VKINGKITVAQVLVGYVGLLLLGAATLSIGLFASALTRNQLVAAVIAAALVCVMCFIYVLANKVDPPLNDAINQIGLFWVHFHGSFEKGIVNLKDIIYYVATTYFFLLLATKTLEAKRWQ
jgi:ABC-2 type transport system permease protein